MGLTPAPVTGQAKPPSADRAGEKSSRTAWIFLLPALVLLGIFLVYPALHTFALSFNRGRGGNFTEWVGLRNYDQLLTRDPNFINFNTFPPSGALWNNVLWIIFYTGFVLGLGLIIAVMATRVRYETLIKAIVFLPQAIAATALGVIWRFVYAPNPEIGALNAAIGSVGVGPFSWLGDPRFVNAALITAGIWGSVGFATVILSAAIKSIPTEILEAARTDGANERQIFTRIIVPMVSLPMSVLAVTLIVNVIKLFDLIYVMTGGGPGSSSRVIAFSFYQEALAGGQFGRGAAIAVVMLIILIPVMIFNLRRFRTEAVT